MLRAFGAMLELLPARDLGTVFAVVVAPAASEALQRK
jgi:hypothetical protein